MEKQPVLDARPEKKIWSTPAILAVSKASDSQVGTNSVTTDFNVGDSITYVS